MAGCGHKTRQKDTLAAFGKTIIMKIFFDEDGSTSHCHRCLEKMTIRCAWCGLPIFIGDPVTLYSPRDKDMEMPEYAVRYKNNAFVGCLRWACADSGADRSGFWYPLGEVYRVLSPLEQCLQSGEMVIIGDLGDIQQALPIEMN
ncbi:MAG: hypothetical protein WCG84_03675 [Candidatus Moraniibacteriota bacterium]